MDLHNTEQNLEAQVKIALMVRRSKSPHVGYYVVYIAGLHRQHTVYVTPMTLFTLGSRVEHMEIHPLHFFLEFLFFIFISH